MTLSASSRAVVTACAMSLDLFHFRTSEDAGRQEDQNDGKDREGGDVLVIDREISRPHRFDDADQEPSHDRAWKRADAAEDRRREGLYARHEAIGEDDHAVIHHE